MVGCVLGSRVQGLGFRVSGSGCRASVHQQGLGFRVDYES